MLESLPASIFGDKLGLSLGFLHLFATQKLVLTVQGQVNHAAITPCGADSVKGLDAARLGL